ncbi:MAG: hypothetical protein R2762_14720 [Bryobacteraceae bacterium]
MSGNTESWMCLMAASICFGSFARAMRRHFAAERPLAPMTAAAAVCGAASAVLHLFGIWTMAGTQPGTLYGWALCRPWAAVAMYGASLGLFRAALRASRHCGLRACYDAGAPVTLAAEGPYRWIRHPFYTAYMIAWAAGVVASGWWPLAASGVLMSAFYARAAILEERALLAGPIAGRYRRYMRSRGRFLPWKIPGGANAGQ